MVLFEENPRILKAALIFCLYALLMDIGSTMLGEGTFYPVISETNTMLVNHEGRYIPWMAVLLNSVGTLSLWGPLSLALGCAFKRWSIASLPFWYLGVAMADAGAANLILFTRVLLASKGI